MAPAASILAAAMVSRSAVLTPGATASAAARRAAATACPASHMNASCAGVLICTPGAGQPVRGGHWRTSVHEPAQRAERPLGDLVHRPGGVQAEQGALVGVERDQRGGLLLVHLQPVPDRLLAVVVPLEQLAAAVVADPGH